MAGHRLPEPIFRGINHQQNVLKNMQKTDISATSIDKPSKNKKNKKQKKQCSGGLQPGGGGWLKTSKTCFFVFFFCVLNVFAWMVLKYVFF